MLPAILQLATFVAYNFIANKVVNFPPNAHLMVLSWQNTIHPLICFIFVKPLVSTFCDLSKKSYNYLKSAGKENLKIIPLSISLAPTASRSPKELAQ